MVSCIWQQVCLDCRGLSWSTTAEKLEAYFSNFGQVHLLAIASRGSLGAIRLPVPALVQSRTYVLERRGQQLGDFLLLVWIRLSHAAPRRGHVLSGQVLEAFVSYDRHTGRPRGFGFVVFEDSAVADKVSNLAHTIDRREVRPL